MNSATFEILIYMGIFIFLLYKLNILEILEGTGKLRITGLIIIVILLLSGQGIKNNKITYPFSYWSMYSNITATNSFMEYNITLSDGSKIHYPFDLITNYSPRAFMRNIEYLSMRMNKNNRKELNKLLYSLDNIYTQKYPRKKIKSFVINRVTIPVNNWYGPESIRRSNIYKLNIRK